MAHVTQNGDLKEREKEKVHERNIHLGEFVSYVYSNPSLAAALMGDYVGKVSVDSPRGPFRLLNDTLLRCTSLVVLTMAVSFWLRSLFPRPCYGRALLRTDSSVAQSSPHRNETV